MERIIPIDMISPEDIGKILFSIICTQNIKKENEK
jgi:hypothetical protein